MLTITLLVPIVAFPLLYVVTVRTQGLITFWQASFDKNIIETPTRYLFTAQTLALFGAVIIYVVYLQGSDVIKVTVFALFTIVVENREFHTHSHCLFLLTNNEAILFSVQSVIFKFFCVTLHITIITLPLMLMFLAGPLGFKPRTSVLETDVLDRCYYRPILLSFVDLY